MKLYQFCASIVAYENSPEDIVSALRSILSVPMRVKCSVIDNSPTQNLRSHVLDTGAEYVYTGANIGFGSGHNLALRSDLGDSEYHIVLNPDVSFGSEVLITLYGFMNDHLDVGLVMPQILYPDGAEQRLCKLIPAPLDLISRRFLGGLGRSMLSTRLCRYELRDLDLSVAREIPCLSGCFMFMRSATLSEVGLFDERYFMYMEDVDLCRRIGEKHKTVFCPEVAVTHGYAKGSYRNSTLLRYHLQSAFKYFMKWGWLYDRKRAKQNEKTDPLVQRNM